MKSKKIILNKKRNPFYTVMIWITSLVCVITGVLVGGFVHMSMSIAKYEENLHVLSQEVEDMQEATREALEQQEQYKSQLELLEKELAQYKPIVIPDSMKHKSS